MHPKLQEIATELEASGDRPGLALHFGLACVQDIAGNLENDEAIAGLARFRACMTSSGTDALGELSDLAAAMADLASSHPGSRSIDGTRHAAVSATYALAKAVNGRAIEAAAYAAYSTVYGYGGYAVTDPDLFAEVHSRQLATLRALKRMPER